MVPWFDKCFLLLDDTTSGVMNYFSTIFDKLQKASASFNCSWKEPLTILQEMVLQVDGLDGNGWGFVRVDYASTIGKLQAALEAHIKTLESKALEGTDKGLWTGVGDHDAIANLESYLWFDEFAPERIVSTSLHRIRKMYLAQLE